MILLDSEIMSNTAQSDTFHHSIKKRIYDISFMILLCLFDMFF